MKTREEVKKIFEPRKVMYKRVSMQMPHCPVCGEQLQGDNSIALPFECSCGIWEGEWGNPSMYKIKNIKEQV